MRGNAHSNLGPVVREDLDEVQLGARKENYLKVLYLCCTEGLKVDIIGG